MGNDSERKQHFLQHKEKHSHNKEASTDGSKSTGRKAGFAALPVDASIHTTEMTAMRENKKEDIRWVIYTDLLSSMLAIEINRENHPILNRI